MNQSPHGASRASGSDDNQRRSFISGALQGPMALFSVWSNHPELAIKGFNLARQACLDSIATCPNRSQLAGQMHPLACRLIAQRANAFEAEAKDSPRAQNVMHAWREAFSDVFEVSSSPIDDKCRLLSAGDGPLWLLTSSLSRKPASPEPAMACAAHFVEVSSPKWGHALACAPEGTHIFSIGPGIEQCLALRMSSKSDQWDQSKLRIADSFSRSFTAPEYSCESLDRSMQARFWGQPDQALHVLRSFSQIDGQPFDVLAALLAHCSAPVDRANALSLDWTQHCSQGSLSAPDALFALIWAPPRSLADLLHIVERAALPSPTLLHAGLTRLAGAPQSARDAVAVRMLAWSRELASHSSQTLAAPSLRVPKGLHLKTLSANALELALRAAIVNKASPASPEGESLRSILDLCVAQGALLDTRGAPNSMSTKDKLFLAAASSKSPEPRCWIAWAEAVEIGQAAKSDPTILAKRLARL